MSDKQLTMGVIGTANKENEQRAPLDPVHLGQIDPGLRQRIFMETGYGTRFNVTDVELEKQVAGLMPREALFEHCDIILLPKPTEADLPSFREGQILWGWPHCVQGPAITQAGIDKRLTMIAWEAMNIWRNDIWQAHVFQKNNELAGYCSVLHALQLNGMTGLYGPPKRAAVISFGSTSRGAIHALRSQGYHDITVITYRHQLAIVAQMPGVTYWEYTLSDAGDVLVVQDDQTESIAEVLADFDIVVNCILQNPNRPLMFVQGDEIDRFRPGSLIVDVSCDAGMGFDFAKPTSFADPIFAVGNGITYYAVDHSPSYLWRSATYEISFALLPYIEVVMNGPDAWRENETIRRAIEIENGVIQNEDILQFQNRSAAYPHEFLSK
ncbi:N(5)-(carboxyethyl)ornithine synthase [Candidatus Leptofilum sp.]|uniref:N(5)-(carboxyethyl)ornithine synthase n=1 Tax=Candidatus Leptofilum sp. TaxID=3241576 RepID=UPI003B5B7A17